MDQRHFHNLNKSIPKLILKLNITLREMSTTLNRNWGADTPAAPSEETVSLFEKGDGYPPRNLSLFFGKS